MLYAGVLWFVPSVGENDDYGKVYSSFAGPWTSDSTDTLSEPTLAGVHPSSSPSPLPGGVQSEKVKNEQGNDPRQRQEGERIETQATPPPSTTLSHSDVSPSSEAAIANSVNSPSVLDINDTITAKRREKIVEVNGKVLLLLYPLISDSGKLRPSIIAGQYHLVNV